METNLDRIITDMEKMAEFTSTTEGVTRLSYSKEDKQAKEYLKKEMKKVNLKIWEDGFGNLFGRREGLNPDAPVVMIGSHYDTVFHGGPIDGVAGVVAALEVLRVLEDNNIENYYPIELIAMNAEEGYRFGISAGTGIANSRALVGKMTEEELDSAKDRDGISKREAMIDYGLVPDLNNVTRPKGSIKTFIELHNEQGRVLEETNTDIGIVDCFPGTGTYLLKFKGRLDNTAVPMDARKDPLLAASKFVIAVNKIAKKMDGKISGQVGRLNVDPNLAAYVSEEVNLNVQFRIFDEHTHNTIDLYEILEQEVKRIEKETDVEIELKSYEARRGYSNPTPPIQMSKENNKIIEEVCEELKYSYIKAPLGIFHDAVIIGEFFPATLIYVPCEGGITHHPDEWTDYKDIKKGVDVMLHLVKKASNK